MTPAEKRPETAAEVRTGARKRRGLIAGALALIVVAGAAAWLLVDGAGPREGGSAAPAVPSAIPLATAAPTDVPQTVLVDAPQLPPNLPPVALAEPSTYGNGVDARLVSIEAFDARAQGPGEVSGPALAVTVELTNAGTDPVSLATVAVNLYFGRDGTPAVRVTDRTGTPLRGELAAGKSARATYAFTVPAEQRDIVAVAVSYLDGSGTAVFSGAVS
jgi:hypothetical protein